MVPTTLERDGVAPLEFCIIARKAAVFGDGGGNETGPPMSGVSPVPGVRPVRGVSPVRKEVGSKAGRGWSLLELGWGPASIAGDSGPDRNEFDMPDAEKPHVYDGSDGDEMLASGGRTGLDSGGEPECARSGCWWEEEGRASSLAEVELEEAAEERVGDFCSVLTDESLDGRAKDCSKGLGSRSNVVRRGLGSDGRADADEEEGRASGTSGALGGARSWSGEGTLAGAWTWVAMTTPD